MSKDNDTVTLSKSELMRLIYQYERAIRDYSYARGVRDGLNRLARFERPVEMCIADFATGADRAEEELYDYVIFSDNSNNDNNG